MNKSNLNIPRILTLAVAAFFLVQCNKDEDPPTPPAELIIGTWKITGATINPPYDIGTGVPITDAFAHYDACEKDDITIFTTNRVGEFNQGATKCDPAAPQSTPFQYALSLDNTTLSINAVADFTIVQLDGKTLKISETFDENGVTYTETFIFTRQ